MKTKQVKEAEQSIPACMSKYEHVVRAAVVRKPGVLPLLAKLEAVPEFFSLRTMAFVIWILGWPWRQIARAWAQRRKVWVLLDKYLGWWATWRRFNRWRRLRIVAACDRKKRAIQGTLFPNGEPGKMCAQCGYAQQITPKEFKRLFGISVDTAIKRAVRRGHTVHNAEKWAAAHR